MNVANRRFTSDGAYYYSRRYSGDTMMHGSQYKFLLAGAILVLLTVLSFSAPSRAATFQVDANCSLAEAIGLANSNLPPLVSAPGIRTCAVQGDIFVRDIIILPSNTQLNFTSPHLGGGKNALPVITSSIKIIGNGSTLNRRSGFFRFIEVSNGGDLILESLTLSNAAHDYNGGAIYNQGNLKIDRCTIDNNKTENGGGIYSIGGLLTIIDSTLSNNQASAHGGGAYINGSTANISNSTFSGNRSDLDAGLLNDSGPVSLRNVTFANNGPLPTGSNNSATIGLYVGGGTISMTNTIIDGDLQNACGGVPIANGGSNWIGDDTCTGTASTGSVGLGGLSDNGGSTLTHALLAESAAIDTGNNNVCAAAPINNLDQRGNKRPQGNRCDIGAYEFSEESSFFVIPIPGGKAVIFSL